MKVTILLSHRCCIFPAAKYLSAVIRDIMGLCTGFGSNRLHVTGLCNLDTKKVTVVYYSYRRKTECNYNYI